MIRITVWACPGAYGLRWDGLPAPAVPQLPPVPAAWPAWRLEMRQGSGGSPHALSPELALLPAGPRGITELRRAEQLAIITVPDPTDVVPLLHPFLSTVSAVVTRWTGDLAFHAAAVVVGGRAWGVVGQREAGKSTLVAALSSAGAAVVADDLLVVRDGDALAGPRCGDLREATAEALGLGVPVPC